VSTKGGLLEEKKEMLGGADLGGCTGPLVKKKKGKTAGTEILGGGEGFHSGEPTCLEKENFDCRGAGGKDHQHLSGKNRWGRESKGKRKKGLPAKKGDFRVKR